MGIDLYWDNDEQTTFLLEFNGKWLWDDLHKVLRTINKISVEREFPLGAIIDLRNGTTMPDGSIFHPETRNHFIDLLKMNDGKRGPIAVVSTGNFIKVLFEAIHIIDKNATKDVFVTKSMDDAQRFIYQQLDRTA